MRQSVDFAANPLLLIRDKIASALLKTAFICYLMEYEKRSSHAYRMIRIVDFCKIFISDFTGYLNISIKRCARLTELRIKVFTYVFLFNNNV